MPLRPLVFLFVLVACSSGQDTNDDVSTKLPETWWLQLDSMASVIEGDTSKIDLQNTKRSFVLEGDSLAISDYWKLVGTAEEDRRKLIMIRWPTGAPVAYKSMLSGEVPSLERFYYYDSGMVFLIKERISESENTYYFHKDSLVGWKRQGKLMKDSALDARLVRYYSGKGLDIHRHMTHVRNVPGNPGFEVDGNFREVMLERFIAEIKNRQEKIDSVKYQPARSGGHVIETLSADSGRRMSRLYVVRTDHGFMWAKYIGGTDGTLSSVISPGDLYTYLMMAWRRRDLQKVRALIPAKGTRLNFPASEVAYFGADTATFNNFPFPDDLYECDCVDLEFPEKFDAQGQAVCVLDGSHREYLIFQKSEDKFMLTAIESHLKGGDW